MQKDTALFIKNFKQKIIQLVADKNLLQKHNLQLQDKLNKLDQTTQQQQTEIQKLTQQIKAIQLLQNNLPQDEKKELLKAINKHITTLQNSITLLSE